MTTVTFITFTLQQSDPFIKELHFYNWTKIIFGTYAVIRK